MSWNEEHNGQEYAENSKSAKYVEFAKYTKYAKYAEFAKYTKYAENVMLIWTDHVSKRDFPFIEPANIKLILWRSSCQRWSAAARQETTWWRRSLLWQLRVVTFNQKVQKFFLSLTFSMCYCASIICWPWRMKMLLEERWPMITIPYIKSIQSIQSIHPYKSLWMYFKGLRWHQDYLQWIIMKWDELKLRDKWQKDR